MMPKQKPKKKVVVRLDELAKDTDNDIKTMLSDVAKKMPDPATLFPKHAVKSVKNQNNSGHVELREDATDTLVLSALEMSLYDDVENDAYLESDTAGILNGTNDETTNDDIENHDCKKDSLQITNTFSQSIEEFSLPMTILFLPIINVKLRRNKPKTNFLNPHPILLRRRRDVISQ